MSVVSNEFNLTAYIDESGEPGTNFEHRPSEFLVMAAAIMPPWIPDIEGQFFSHVKKLEKVQKGVVPKFQKCGPKLKYLLCSLLPYYPVSMVSVVFHKPSLKGTYIGRNPNSMYSYLLKFTLERVSWFARDAQHPLNPTNGLCNVRFSENSGLSYEAIKFYLDKLRREGGHNHSILWEYLHTDDAKPEPHSDESRYHFADIMASATFSAFDPSNRRHSETDDRFLRLLWPSICRDQRSAYGFKFFPPSAPIADRRLFEFLKLLR